MQYARCTLDGETWEAIGFSQLGAAILETKRRALVCSECGEFAWFRKASRHGHPAHFCAHHDDECSLKINYVVAGDPQANPDQEVEEVSSGDDIIVRLDQEQGGPLAVTPVPPPPSDGGREGGRTFTVKGGNQESSQQFTLRRILHRLRQSPDFRASNSRIVFLKSNEEVMIEGLVRDVVVGFEAIGRQHHERRNFYWGPIASVGRTKDNRIWLNSGAQYGAASVVIFDDIADEFLQRFEIDDLEDLCGAYVLAAGNCTFSGEGQGKPIVWCGTTNYIFVRKYNYDYQSEG